MFTFWVFVYFLPASSKPPVASSAERSKSFNPKSRQRQISGFLNRSLSQLPKSFSHNSLDRGAAKLGRAVRQQAASSAAMLIR